MAATVDEAEADTETVRMVIDTFYRGLIPSPDNPLVYLEHFCLPSPPRWEICTASWQQTVPAARLAPHFAAGKTRQEEEKMLAGKLPERSQADDDDDAPQCDHWSESEREKDLYQHVMLKSSLATSLQWTKQPLQLLHRVPQSTVKNTHTTHTFNDHQHAAKKRKLPELPPWLL